MYKVIRQFFDTKTDHLYEIGDTYPIEGHRLSKARAEELLKGANKYGEIYLKEVKTTFKK